MVNTCNFARDQDRTIRQAKGKQKGQPSGDDCTCELGNKLLDEFVGLLLGEEVLFFLFHVLLLFIIFQKILKNPQGLIQCTARSLVYSKRKKKENKKK